VPLLPLRDQFEVKNRLLLDGVRQLTAEELAIWSHGRDFLVGRVLAREAAATPAAGSTRRRHPRTHVRVAAHLAGHGGGFTDDLGFGGLGLRTHRVSPLRRGDEASVKLKWAERSIFLQGQVAWTEGTRLGLSITRIHPQDEQLLQALVCERLGDVWEG
jgi:hypothetical protein